jgi:hypothetical protein
MNGLLMQYPAGQKWYLQHSQFISKVNGLMERAKRFPKFNYCTEFTLSASLILIKVTKGASWLTCRFPFIEE